MPKSPLTEKDWQDAAAALGVDIPRIKAVAKVEAPKGAFLPSGEPPVLFERHKFHAHTGGRFDESNPDLSNPKWGGYGKASEQHARLQRAAELDREAALKSASWGQFQILGENYRQAGFDSVQDFVNAMYRDAASQLRAFVDFIRNDAELLTALRASAWSKFARRYNGPAYATHGYHTRLAEAYAAERGVA